METGVVPRGGFAAAATAEPGTTAPTFLDPGLQAQMERDGYVVVSMFDAADIALARGVYERHHGEPSAGCVTDYEVAAPADKAAMADELSSLYARRLPEVLDDHAPFLVSFVMKWPGDDSAMVAHQDWTYVDERRFRSVTVWFALDDASPELDNGPLCVIPGSHRVAENWRGTRTPSWFGPLGPYLERHGQVVPVRAGDAVIFDNRLIHYSAPNRSGAPRLALACGSAPRAARLLHPVDAGNGLVNLLAVGPEFYFAHSPASLWEQAPEGEVVGIVPQVREPLDPARLAALCGEAPPAAALAEVQAQQRPALGASEPTQGGDGIAGNLLASALRVNHRIVTRHLAADTGPLADRSLVPWLDDLEAGWEAIRDEYLAAGLVLPTMADVAGTPMPVDGRWAALVLRENRGWITHTARRFPATSALLQQVPGLRSACFSVLDPGAEILPHRGANNGVYRVHLGIVVPDPPGSCALEVGPEWVPWVAGQAFAFDDTWEHQVRNQAATARVSLMLEVDRPLSGVAGVVNRIVQPMFRLHPQVRGARRRVAELDQALNG